MTRSEIASEARLIENVGRLRSEEPEEGIGWRHAQLDAHKGEHRRQVRIAAMNGRPVVGSPLSVNCVQGDGLPFTGPLTLALRTCFGRQVCRHESGFRGQADGES